MSNQFTARPQRQGDILLFPVKQVPKGLKPVAKEGGRVVVAHGEVTGHAHVIDDPEVLFLESDLGEMADRFLIAEHECRMVHDEHGPLTVPSIGDLKKAGFEGIGVRRQVEYAPEEIRQVAD